MAPIKPRLRKKFPNLSAAADETSEEDDSYNCIAWAAGDTEHHWWPVDFPTNGVVWPIDPPEDTVEGFIAGFATLGYVECNDGSLEAGVEKLALYVNAQGEPTHMARQLASGHWTSKIGTLWEDISHPTLEELEGPGQYGSVKTYLKRPRQ